ncbi:MAG: FtsW/RodA/SpoVE family cell cycle protein [Lachnospiraceae bacterium]
MLFESYHIRHYNFRLILYMLALNVIGLLVIGSATYSTQGMALVLKQAFGIGVGLAAAIILSLIPYQKILRFSWGIYGACSAMLLAVLLWGRLVGGATRWIVLPGIGQIQPSEFAKIGLIVFFAWYLSKYQERINAVTTLAIAAGLFAVPVVLILEEPDLSTSLVIVFFVVCMVFTAGISFKWIAGVLAVFAPIAILFVYLLRYDMIPFLEDYQARRILAWVYPKLYAEANYQQDNSIMAIASGQLHGKGLYNNTLASVKNGNFLSEDQTDFIFAVIGEELGFIGCMIVIILFLAIVYECLWMASKARDTAGKLICTGIASMIAFQSFANIAVATGVFPNTGLPLPLVSYGVSSLLSIYLGMGLALNVGLQRKINH